MNREPVGAKARIFASTSFLTLGVVVNALIGILIARTLARHLGVAGYGQYALAFVFLSFTGVLVNFGFDTILIRELAKDEKHANALLTAGIVLKLLFAAGAVGVGTLYVLSRGFPPAYTGAVAALLLTHFVAAFDTFEVAHKARLRGGSVAIASVCSQLLALGIVLTGQAADWPLEWLIVAHLFVRVPRAALLYLRWRAFAPFVWTWDRERTRFILRESAVVGLTGILWIVYFKVDQLMLDRLQGPEAVGQYAAAHRFIDMALLGSGLVMSSLAPLLAERWTRPGAAFGSVYRQTVSYMALLGALAGGAMVVLAPDLIFHLISPRFTEAVGILRILAVAAFLIYLNNAFAHAMVAVGIQGPGFLSTRIAAAGLNVVLNLLWIPVWGGQGAAWATVASEGVILLLAPWFVRRRAGVWPPLWGPVLGGAALWLSGAANRAAGATPLEPSWAGRLAGCGVLAGALLIFLAFHRRQVVDLLVGLRVLKPKPETREPDNPQTED